MRIVEEEKPHLMEPKIKRELRRSNPNCNSCKEVMSKDRMKTEKMPFC